MYNFAQICFCFDFAKLTIEMLNNNSHGLSPSGGLVSPSGGFVSLLCDQGLHFASIKLCLALSHQGAKIKIPVVRCHYLLCLTRQYKICQYCNWHRSIRFTSRKIKMLLKIGVTQKLSLQILKWCVIGQT